MLGLHVVINPPLCLSHSICDLYISVLISVFINSGGEIISSPADFVRLPTDKEMISL